MDNSEDKHEGPLSGCGCIFALLVAVWLVGYLESIRDSLGFSIVGVIIIVLIFVGVDKMSKK